MSKCVITGINFWFVWGLKCIFLFFFGTKKGVTSPWGTFYVLNKRHELRYLVFVLKIHFRTISIILFQKPQLQHKICQLREISIYSNTYTHTHTKLCKICQLFFLFCNTSISSSNRLFLNSNHTKAKMKKECTKSRLIRIIYI